MQMLKIRQSFLLLFFLLGVAIRTTAQSPTRLTLDQCYDLARLNYPLIKQKELLAKSLEFTIANVQSGHLPQVTIGGQATYQSEVTRLPGPSTLVEPLSKDQYKVFGEINQNIFDGGVVKSQATIQRANSQIEQQKLEVELYKIKDRINQIFFGVLLMNAQLEQVELLKKDLNTSLQKTETSIKNGIAFKTGADIIKAEILKSDQRVIEIQTARSTYLDMLGYFINQALDETTFLETPVTILPEPSAPNIRPELKLYQFQNDLLGAQFKSTSSRNLPKVGAFFQGGYGRPALNLLKNEFDFYYLGGLRLNWSLSGLYNANREKQLLDVNTQSVNALRETFSFNTNLALKQQSKEVRKLNDLIAVDEQIITLRAKIKSTAQSQYDNGVISTNDLLKELNAEDVAKQNLIYHQVQLLLAQYNYQTTLGN
jgi:outer membrane protein TolC